MRKTSGMKSAIFLYVVFALLIVGAILTAAIYRTHISTIIRPDGEVSPSSWPKQYAESFETYINFPNGTPQISDNGVSSLNKNQLWVQILDEQGNQIAEHNKPTDIPAEYSIAQLLDFAEIGRFNEYTIYVLPLFNNGQSYEYLVGFPIGITKTTTYYNNDRFAGDRTVVFTAFAILCFVVLIAVLIYGVWLTRHISRIVQSSGEIAARTYQPRRTKGAFADAYRSMNKLNTQIEHSDKIRDDTDRMREEWIANITHDLKTPLSPIKGYAELLCEGQYDADKIQKYGKIILKNTAYTEQLINDLKLTYQIESGAVPVNKQIVNLARETKELIIELLNSTEYSNREIRFDCEKEDIYVNLDMPLFRRAVTNILVNALAHNLPEAEVVVSLSKSDEITLSVSDTGKGLTGEEKKNLFSRYYRGGNTDEKPEGSGLGLAIAKQITELHEGNIEVQSEPGTGTSIIIRLPKDME